MKTFFLVVTMSAVLIGGCAAEFGPDHTAWSIGPQALFIGGGGHGGGHRGYPGQRRPGYGQQQRRPSYGGGGGRPICRDRRTGQQVDPRFCG